MQVTRTIALAMTAYASDNGKYPDGESSTEVFQKLLDGNYVSDPALFYLPLSGKTRPTGGKLKPENVTFDVTSGITANSSDTLPMVFLTGFRIDYRAGGSAVSLVKPLPGHGWFASIFDRDNAWDDGVAIGYKNNNAYYKTLGGRDHQVHYDPDGYAIVPDIVPENFDAHGQTYRQLMPDGVLK